MSNQALNYSIFSQNYQKKEAINFLNNVLEINKDINKNDKLNIIDFGCGNGEITSYLSTEVFKKSNIIGLDIDNDRINLAKHKFDKIKNLKFIKLDNNNKIEENGINNFDLIISTFVFHWIQDKLNIFQKIYNSLKKDGCFASIYINGSDEIKEIMVNSTNGNIKHYYTDKKDIENIFKIIGFKILKIEEHDIIFKFDDIEEIFNWYEATTHGIFKKSYLNIEQIENIKLKEPNIIVKVIEFIIKK